MPQNLMVQGGDRAQSQAQGMGAGMPVPEGLMGEFQFEVNRLR